MNQITHAPDPAPAAPTDSEMAASVKAHLAAGDRTRAREEFGELVARLQRRATRIAFSYLRDAAEADEAVQDAFVKVYGHLDVFREELSFDTWFNRILVNCCLDRIKALGRRRRWLVCVEEPENAVAADGTTQHHGDVSPEGAVLLRERAELLVRAIAKLPGRQRLVVTLSQLEERSTKEVSEMTGLNQSTVRVHLFRGLRRLRTLLATDAALGGIANRTDHVETTPLARTRSS